MSLNIKPKLPKVFLPHKSFLMSNGKLIKLKPVALPDRPVLNLVGIKETSEAIDLIATIANTIAVIALTGWNIGLLGGITKSIPIFFKLIPAVKGIGNVITELEDLTPDEKQELIDLVQDKLLFKEDVEAIITMALDILYKLKVLAGVFK